MKTKRSPLSFDCLDQIRKEIMQKDPDGDCFYRGESRCYPNVSSSLYRYFDRTAEHRWSTMSEEKKENMLCLAEDRIISYAKQFSVDTIYLDIYIHEVCESFSYSGWRYKENLERDLLVSIQHKGGKTNLIDFTNDIHIALFFACNDQPEEDGRIILYYPGQSNSFQFALPKTLTSTAQHSVMVRPVEGGTIKDFDTIIVPKEKKRNISRCLKEYHNVRLETIFDNLDGYIRNQHLLLPLLKD